MPVFSSCAQSKAADKASKAQVQAQRDLINFTKGESAKTEARLQPYTNIGLKAINPLLDASGINGAVGNKRALSMFQTSPGYSFQMGQGVQALDRSAAARGGLYGGQQAKALTQYGQGLANQEFGNFYNRLTGLTQLGQNSAAQVGAQLAPLQQSTMQGISNIGDARAAGYIGQGNAQASGFSQLAKLGGSFFGLF